jgi:RHH-type transcriptional regulator, proline utilization regulon repressor / proline dehydrogenase / delta 1-pyrroline-5-carboxylate dehydrogenase
MYKESISLKNNYRRNEEELVKELIEYLRDSSFFIENAELSAFNLAEHFRSKSKNKIRVENLMNAYPLSSDRGRHLMSLAECLLRIPDSGNREKLVIEKMRNNWISSISNGLLMFSFGIILQIVSMLLPKKNNNIFTKFISSITSNITKKVIHIMSYQFVLAQNINHALKRSKKQIDKGYGFSFDMLGESARTDVDAQKYFNDYKNAIIATGEFSRKIKDPKKVSISIKLSSLHCRYEPMQFKQIKPILYGRLLELCKISAKYNLLLFIDAEEVERLVLSLELFEDLLKEKELENWQGLAIVIQSYQKRGFFVIDEIAEMANRYKRKIYVRLVKGAYWDAETKRDQVNGASDFALFTLKEHTDICYMACVKKLSTYEKEIFPCFATHNAFSIAFVEEIMKGKNFEYQCLQGMGGDLYSKIINKHNVRIYAPVGEFTHLLPYLVRRLIENGAKSSFINQILLKDSNIKDIVKNPIEKSNQNGNKMNSLIKLPRDLFISEGRANSKGEDMADQNVLDHLEEHVGKYIKKENSYSIISGEDIKSDNIETNTNPANIEDQIGLVYRSTDEIISKSIDVAYDYFPIWKDTSVERRAEILVTASNNLEASTEELVAILVREAGKSIKDALLEIREAVDFLRYYAHRAKIDFNENGISLPSPVGESNTLYLNGRGVFLCIAPWNFPLAIFLGQLAAALASGNTVIAKSSEDTPLIGYKAIKILINSGVPKEALQYLPAKGKLIGDSLLQHPKLAGVAFTGSDKTAKDINIALANRNYGILPLIAETGGQNAMIVDSTALLEQVVRDVISSSFQSAGQRCSALRVLFVQSQMADPLIEMIKHAMDELFICDPKLIQCDVGPVINQIAYNKINQHCIEMQKNHILIKQSTLPKNLKGYFFPPTVFEISSINDLKQEIFGPILHIVRYKDDNLDQLIHDIHNTGYGLTFSIHSRLEKNIESFSKKLQVGNIYVNRNQIGAVVSSQPFGGSKNSGTGPKAGGPFYLHKFATEKTISTDLTAWGGNIDLMSKI